MLRMLSGCLSFSVCRELQQSFVESTTEECQLWMYWCTQKINWFLIQLSGNYNCKHFLCSLLYQALPQAAACKTLPTHHQAFFLQLEGRKWNGFSVSSLLTSDEQQDPWVLMATLPCALSVLSSVFSKICGDCRILCVDVWTPTQFMLWIISHQHFII